MEFIQTFAPQYEDLRHTVPDLPAFDPLAAELHYSIRKTEVLEVNARPTTPQPDWSITYPWILVGGQAVDRGFTVEGLTVTYMPRDLGVGNADTVQQRARFFGYKRGYLGFCRVFLEQGVRQAFEHYVAHERDIRDRLSLHREAGAPLREWRRAFFLDSTLRPTRRQVLDLDYQQDSFSDGWFWPKVPQGAEDLLTHNRQTAHSFIQGLQWADDVGDPRRTPEQVHLVATGVPLRAVFSDLLTPIRLTDERDSQRFTGLLLQLDDYLQRHPDVVCTIYRMSAGRERLRSVNDDDEIPTLFQGANYADAAHHDRIYPGDEECRGSVGLTVQVHTLEIRQKDRGPVIASAVPALAIWVPASMKRDWLVQERR